MDLFSLDSVILIIVTCNCLPFSYSRSNFSDTYVMTSAESSVSEPPNLTIFQGGYPQTPYNAIMPTRYKKKLSYSPTYTYSACGLQDWNREQSSIWLCLCVSVNCQQRTRFVCLSILICTVQFLTRKEINGPSMFCSTASYFTLCFTRFSNILRSRSWILSVAINGELAGRQGMVATQK